MILVVLCYIASVLHLLNPIFHFLNIGPPLNSGGWRQQGAAEVAGQDLHCDREFRHQRPWPLAERGGPRPPRLPGVLHLLRNRAGPGAQSGGIGEKDQRQPFAATGSCDRHKQRGLENWELHLQALQQWGTGGGGISGDLGNVGG